MKLVQIQTEDLVVPAVAMPDTVMQEVVVVAELLLVLLRLSLFVSIMMGEYLPYGQDRNSNALLQHSAYKFTDQEQDEGTGLYNYDARLYDPEIGQFVMADSIVPDAFNPQSLNRYAYCLNNPVRYIDPTGHHTGGYGGPETGDEGPNGHSFSGGHKGAGKGNSHSKEPMAFVDLGEMTVIGHRSDFGGGPTVGTNDAQYKIDYRQKAIENSERIKANQRWREYNKKLAEQAQTWPGFYAKKKRKKKSIIKHDPALEKYRVVKGSLALAGIGLTVFGFFHADAPMMGLGTCMAVENSWNAFMGPSEDVSLPNLP